MKLRRPSNRLPSLCFCGKRALPGFYRCEKHLHTKVFQPPDQRPRVKGQQPHNPMPPGWSNLRQDFLSDHPTCQACDIRPAWHADHILPRRYFPEEALNYDNLQALCKTCHQRKTLVEKTRILCYKPNKRLNIIIQDLEDEASRQRLKSLVLGQGIYPTP